MFKKIYKWLFVLEFIFWLWFFSKNYYHNFMLYFLFDLNMFKSRKWICNFLSWSSYYPAISKTHQISKNFKSNRKTRGWAWKQHGSPLYGEVIIKLGKVKTELRETSIRLPLDDSIGVWIKCWYTIYIASKFCKLLPLLWNLLGFDTLRCRHK